MRRSPSVKPGGRVVARIDRTPTAGAPDSRRGTGRIPEELLSEQVQRLAVFAAVVGAVWAFGLFMDLVVLPVAKGTGIRNWRAIPIEVVATIVSAAMCAFARFSSAGVRAKIDAGLVFMLLNGAGIAAMNAWASLPPRPDEIHISWITVLILVYAMIAPSTPRRILYASLAAASLDLIAFGIVYLAGIPTAGIVTVLVMCWPNFACAAIAMVPSRVLQRIGRRLHEAQELGSYHLVELLGTGGMGEVWRAEHRLLARDAAIKLVRPEVLGARNEAESRQMLRRFEREAQATAMLSSPHTIHVFDFGITQEGTFYYVMELLAGRDLESMVREFGPIPANRVLYLMRQVCHSLADAHARGLVHRDIKPANIYVCRQGLDFDFAKVLDFGLVKFKHRPPGDTLMTLDHTTTGTPAYMAPEAILGDATVDRRADVYALGCVAYFLLTGALVFEADTPMKMLMQHVHAIPAPPSARTELEIPPELDAIVLACLEKDPNKRPQDAGELFRMAQACQTCGGWNRDAARQWWEAHLPELAGPLATATPSTETHSFEPADV
jgi:tRNA A-37 threonylcarbamoyl transferase component Bud32